MSMTSGSARRACASAASIVGANSLSVISTFASPCSSMNAIASASSRVLSVLSTAPVIGTPKWASTISGVLAGMTRHRVAAADAGARRARMPAAASARTFRPSV